MSRYSDAGDVDVLDVDLEVGGGAERLVARHGAVGAAALPALGLGDAEPGVEVDRLHLDPLPPHERERERRVEPARDHRDGLAGHGPVTAPSARSSSRRRPSRNVPRCSLRVALHHMGMSCAIPGSVAMTRSTAPASSGLHRLRRLDDWEGAQAPGGVDRPRGSGHVGRRHAHSFSPSRRAGQRRPAAAEPGRLLARRGGRRYPASEMRRLARHPRRRPAPRRSRPGWRARRGAHRPRP